MSWDQAQREMLARVHVARDEVWTLELRHSLFPAPARLVAYPEDLVLPLEVGAPVDGGTNQTFTARAFMFRPPELGSEPDPTVEVQIDAVGADLRGFLRQAVLTTEPVEGTFRSYMLDVATNTSQLALDVLHLQLRGNRQNMTTISGRFGYVNAANLAFPSEIYTSESNPGLPT